MNNAIITISFTSMFTMNSLTNRNFQIITSINNRQMSQASRTNMIRRQISKAIMNARARKVNTRLSTYTFPPSIKTTMNNRTRVIIVLTNRVALSPTQLSDHLYRSGHQVSPRYFPHLSNRKGRRKGGFTLLRFF